MYHLPTDRESIRADLLSLLSTFQTNVTEEQKDIEEMKIFLRAHTEFLGKTNPAGHVTGSAVVINTTHQSVLLLHHKKLQRWLQPGGHTDPDEHPMATALRETQEETGLQTLSFLPSPDPSHLLTIDSHWIPERPRNARHIHMDFRYLLQASSDTMQLSQESTDGRWFTWKEAEHLELDPSLRRALSRAKQLLNAKLSI